MRAVFQGDVLIFQMNFGLALGVDGEVLHIASVVAVGIVETVLLALRIEMSAGRFEVRPLALRDLVEMDGMLSGREVVQMEFESRRPIPDPRR